MYTDSMSRVVHNIQAPKGFGVNIIENEHFLTIKLNEKEFEKMFHDEKIKALQYIVNLKNALEQNFEIDLVTMEAVQK